MVIAIAKSISEQRQERINALLAQSEGRFRRAIQNNLSQITDGRRFNRIERLIQQEQYEQAINESARIVAETVNAEFVRTYTVGGFEAADFVQRAIGLQVNFNQVNERAIGQLQQETQRLITRFTEQQRQATAQALQAALPSLTEGLRVGVNPRETARAFRDSIGLTPNQEEWVRNYRRALEQNSARSLQYELRDRRFDSTTQNAIDRGEPLSQTVIDRNVQRYRERAIKYRSEVIARTESLRSLNLGLREGFQQQIDNGNLNANQLQRKWVTARDERVRDSHSPMNGQLRPWNEPFVSGAGVTLLHPGDPNAPGRETIQCRCIATTRIDRTREQEQQARSQAQAGARRQPRQGLPSSQQRQALGAGYITAGEDGEQAMANIQDAFQAIDDPGFAARRERVESFLKRENITYVVGDRVGGQNLTFQNQVDWVNRTSQRLSPRQREAMIRDWRAANSTPGGRLKASIHVEQALGLVEQDLDDFDFDEVFKAVAYNAPKGRASGYTRFTDRNITLNPTHSRDISRARTSLEPQRSRIQSARPTRANTRTGSLAGTDFGLEMDVTTFIHETGHQVDRAAREKGLNLFEDMMEEQRGKPPSQFRANRRFAITEYAQSNNEELFAETFTAYMIDPDGLRAYSQEAFEAMDRTFVEVLGDWR